MQPSSVRLDQPVPADLAATTMNGPVGVAGPDAAADARWLAWKASYADSDRRSARTMRWLFTLAIGGVLTGLAMQAVA